MPEGVPRSLVYRASTSRAATVSAAVAVAALSIIAIVVRDAAAVPLVLTVSLLVGGLLAIGLLLGLALRSATVADAAGIKVKGLFGSKRLRWHDIQAIKVEADLAPSDRGPARSVVVYDSAGRRLELPQLHDKNLHDLESAAGELVGMWGRHRGADWQPQPAVVSASVARASRVRMMFVAAIVAGMGCLVLVIMMYVPLLLTAPVGGHTGLLGWLSSPALVLIAPPVAAVAAIAIGWLRGRE